MTKFPKCIPVRKSSVVSALQINFVLKDKKLYATNIQDCLLVWWSEQNKLQHIFSTVREKGAAVIAFPPRSELIQ